LTNETTGGTINVIHPATTLHTYSVSPSTTVAAGTPVTITVTETNTGDSTITGVSVTGTNSCATWTGGSSTLVAGASTQFSCTFTTSSNVTWSATGHGTDILGNAVPAAGETTSGSITVSLTYLAKGDTATIGFWHNKNGQALILSLNGGPSSTALANWLASNFPNLYGSSSPNSLTGKTNADVAALFLQVFGVTGQKTNAQILAGALAVYSTSSTLAGGTYAAGYGFTVSTGGTGVKLFNTGSNGTAIGLMNNTYYTAMQLLAAANAVSPFSSSAFNALNTIFSGLNQGGDI
jgi:hypothetical protein